MANPSSLIHQHSFCPICDLPNDCVLVYIDREGPAPRQLIVTHKICKEILNPESEVFSFAPNRLQFNLAFFNHIRIRLSMEKRVRAVTLAEETFNRPIDVLGRLLNERGEPVDRYGRPVDELNRPLDRYGRLIMDRLNQPQEFTPDKSIHNKSMTLMAYQVENIVYIEEVKVCIEEVKQRPE